MPFFVLMTVVGISRSMISPWISSPSIRVMLVIAPMFFDRTNRYPARISFQMLVCESKRRSRKPTMRINLDIIKESIKTTDKKRPRDNPNSLDKLENRI